MRTNQQILKFHWESPVSFKRAFLTPKNELTGWDLCGNEGFVHSLNSNLSASGGGKLAVFRVSVKGEKAGYMVFDCYDELNRIFDIKYM